ncbi:MAG TPA: DoxX family protein [Candidatus Paceibacterota bacterium]|jgi:Predicted membrane protein
MRNTTDTALLLVRVGLALVFLAHGSDKLTNMADTVAFFGTLGLSAFWAYLIASVEIIGGVAMLLGVWTGWAGVALAATMVGSIGLVKLSHGFIGGYEFDLMLFLSAIAISLSGPGAYTFKRIFKRE